MTRTALTSRSTSLLAAVLAALLLTTSSTAQAQRPFERAVVFSGPAALGYQMPIGESWGLRADVAASRTTFSVGGSQTKTVTAGMGLSALRLLHVDADRVQYYVAPRLGLSRTTFDDGSFSDLWTFDALFGANAALGRRVGVFGETGIRGSYTDNSTPGTVNRNVSASLRGAVGVTLRF